MDTKLTLALDSEVISRAKQYAKRMNTSISKLVENFLSSVAKTEEEEFSPLVRKLSGVITLKGDPKKEYRDHLADKYGK